MTKTFKKTIVWVRLGRSLTTDDYDHHEESKPFFLTALGHMCRTPCNLNVIDSKRSVTLLHEGGL